MFDFVVLDLVCQYLATRLAGKNCLRNDVFFGGVKPLIDQSVVLESNHILLDTDCVNSTTLLL